LSKEQRAKSKEQHRCYKKKSNRKLENLDISGKENSIHKSTAGNISNGRPRIEASTTSPQGLHLWICK
jgi:hypothetical protein